MCQPEHSPRPEAGAHRWNPNFNNIKRVTDEKKVGVHLKCDFPHHIFFQRYYFSQPTSQDFLQALHLGFHK